MTAIVQRSATAVLVALLLAGCGAAGQAGSASAAPSDSAETASPTQAVMTPASSVRVVVPSPSGAGWCLPAEAIAAIREVADGNLAPAIPLSEVADELEALDLSHAGRFVEVRDELVLQLRHPDPEREQGLNLVHVANVFLSDAGALDDTSGVEC